MPQTSMQGVAVPVHEAASTRDPERRSLLLVSELIASPAHSLAPVIGRLSSVPADGGAPTNVTTANAGPAEGVAAVAAWGIEVGGVRAGRVRRRGRWHLNLRCRCRDEIGIDRRGGEHSPDDR
jgi:hypothetical protein